MGSAKNMLSLAQNMTHWWSKQKKHSDDGQKYEYQEVLDRYWNLQAADDATIVALHEPAPVTEVVTVKQANHFVRRGASSNQPVKRWLDHR